MGETTMMTYPIHLRMLEDQTVPLAMLWLNQLQEVPRCEVHNCCRQKVPHECTQKKTLKCARARTHHEISEDSDLHLRMDSTNVAQPRELISYSCFACVHIFDKICEEPIRRNPWEWMLCGFCVTS